MKQSEIVHLATNNLVSSLKDKRALYLQFFPTNAYLAQCLYMDVTKDEMVLKLISEGNNFSLNEPERFNERFMYMLFISLYLESEGL